MPEQGWFQNRVCVLTGAVGHMSFDRQWYFLTRLCNPTVMKVPASKVLLVAAGCSTVAICKHIGGGIQPWNSRTPAKHSESAEPSPSSSGVKPVSGTHTVHANLKPGQRQAARKNAAPCHSGPPSRNIRRSYSERRGTLLQ